MKVTQKELNDLQKIERLFGEIDEIYEGLDPALKEKIQEIHNYEGSLGYCIRWGYQAVEEIIRDHVKDTEPVIDDFKEWCREQAEINNKRYSAQHEDKFIVIDNMWDHWRDDCNMYDYAAEYLADEHPEWFYDCETVEECDEALRTEYKEGKYEVDTLRDKQRDLSYGPAILSGKTILEVGDIGRWNGVSHGLNPLNPENIGNLLKSNHEQWMFYVNKETGEFCKLEAHHDGRNHYTYRELTCEWDEFEELLEKMKEGELDELVEKHSAPIGWRIAEIYGWELNGNSLDQKI